MRKTVKSQLALALRKKLLVRFATALERGTVTGYVLSIGPSFFLVALLSDGGRLNGFQCNRLTDVRKLEVPDEYERFHEAVLKKRGIRFPTKTMVDVRSVANLLLSANKAFPLVTIHREKVEPGACWIGRVVGMDVPHVTLLEIGPDALWDDRLESYRMSEITRIDFGGDYEDALHLVGGGKYKRAIGAVTGNNAGCHPTRSSV